MNPLSLKLRRYRTFDELDLVLPQGCAAIMGQTAQGRSNGAGKSSVVEAIELALFGSCRTGDLADQRTTDASPDEDMLIELEFEHAGTLYRARRTRSARGSGKSTFDLEQQLADGGWEPLTKASIRETQAELERRLGLSHATFRASAFIAQKDGGAFTRAKPKERKDVLAEIVALDRYRTLLERARTDRRRGEDELQQLDGREHAARQLADTRPAVAHEHGIAVAAELDHADTLADREREHAELGQRWQAAREQAARQQAVEAELREARSHLQKLETEQLVCDEAVTARAVTTEELDRLPGGDELEELQQEIDALEARVADHERRAREHMQAAQEAGQVAMRITALQERAAESDRFAADVRARAEMLEMADSAVCQKCGQHVADEAKTRAIAAYLDEAATHDAAAAHDRGEAATAAALCPAVPPPPADAPPTAELQAARARVRTLVDAAGHRARLQERLLALQATIDNRPGPEPLHEAEQAVLGKETELARLQPVDIAALEQEGLAAKHALDSAKAAFDAARTMRARLEERLDQIKAAEESLAATAAARKELNGLLVVVAALERAFGANGIPMLIVENVAIPQIEVDANRFVSDLGYPVQIELRTQREKKDGALADALDFVITDEAGSRPYETFSGGEGTTIDLALQIALAKLLAHRRGADNQLLVIDEPEGLDEQGIAALVAVLRGLQSDFDKLYVVSHVPALRDSFDEVLTVVKGDDGQSRVEEASVFEPVAA